MSEEPGASSDDEVADQAPELSPLAQLAAQLNKSRTASQEALQKISDSMRDVKVEMPKFKMPEIKSPIEILSHDLPEIEFVPNPTYETNELLRQVIDTNAAQLSIIKALFAVIEKEQQNGIEERRRSDKRNRWANLIAVISATAAVAAIFVPFFTK